MNDLRYAFWVRGPLWGKRLLVDADRAFLGYALCDEKAQVECEAYLSAFRFPQAFSSYLEARGSCRGYDGPCGASWLWWDIDRDNNLEQAQKAAWALCRALERDYDAGSAVLAFFSGSKGFHVGLSCELWKPESSLTFHRIARRFAERIAGEVGIEIDSGVYDRVRAFRAPNSRHPKTGLCKRSLTLAELRDLSIEQIQEMAASPSPFEIPSPTASSEPLRRVWQQAQDELEKMACTESPCSDEGDGERRLNRATLEFIRRPIAVGQRALSLFAAAANLAELGSTRELAHAVLTEPALDSGLRPSEVKRQIDCGWEHVVAKQAGGAP